MQLHVIKILAVRWLGTRLIHIFKETTTSDESWVVSWEQISYCFPDKLNISLDGWEGLTMRLEYYIPFKKGFILQSKGVHFENSPPCIARQNYVIFFPLRFTWHSMVSTLQICFLHLCSVAVCVVMVLSR